MKKDIHREIVIDDINEAIDELKTALRDLKMDDDIAVHSLQYVIGEAMHKLTKAIVSCKNIDGWEDIVNRNRAVEEYKEQMRIDA